MTIQRNWQHSVHEADKHNKTTTQYVLDTTQASKHKEHK